MNDLQENVIISKRRAGDINSEQEEIFKKNAGTRI